MSAKIEVFTVSACGILEMRLAEKHEKGHAQSIGLGVTL
jgi:hypothetical protein